MKTILTLFISCSAFIGNAQFSTWNEIPSGTDKHLNVIEFASPMVGYIGGNDSLLLKTTDGGFTWNPHPYSGVSFASGGEHIVNLKFTNENVGYMMVGPYGLTYKTTDGGSTWSPLTFTGVMCYNHAMYMFSTDNGIFGGSGCFQGEHLEVMTNAVLTESVVNTPSWDASDYVLDIDFLDANNGLAVSKSRFLRTTNGGADWDTIPHGFGQRELTSVEIINDTLAFAGYVDFSAGYGLLESNDGGLTWQEEGNMATFFYPDYNDVEQTQNGRVYSVGATSIDSNGILFETFDLSWWSYYLFDHPLHSIDTYGDTAVFAVGDSGLIVTNLTPPVVSTTDLTENLSGLILYPNPTRDAIGFQFNNGWLSTDVTVVIRNTAGQKVMTTATATGLIDVSNLQSGLYFLELTVGEQQYVERFVKHEN